MLTNRHHADDVKAMAEGDGRACRRQVDSEATGARCARQEHSSACIYVALKQSKSQLILHGPKYGSATAKRTKVTSSTPAQNGSSSAPGTELRSTVETTCADVPTRTTTDDRKTTTPTKQRRDRDGKGSSDSDEDDNDRYHDDIDDRGHTTSVDGTCKSTRPNLHRTSPNVLTSTNNSTTMFNARTTTQQHNTCALSTVHHLQPTTSVKYDNPIITHNNTDFNTATTATPAMHHHLQSTQCPRRHFEH
jgi:hypothetical protein